MSGRRIYTRQAGIPAFVDASGKEWSPEAYVNMDIRNTAKNTAQAAQFSCMDELGQDVILVSSHSGARPLCFPYQGKFYSKSDKSGTIKDARGKEYHFEPLSNTSFGKPAGLFGINCGHRMRGVSEGTFINREKQYDETENGEEYEKVCEQRRQERKIRADKTKRDALKAAGDDEGAKVLNSRISAENKQLKAYCEENGLSYRQDRTRTYGYSDTSRKKTPDPLIESVDNSAGSGIINTGGYSGAKKTPGWRERHGERMYEEIRHRTTDVKRIAENTQFTESAVEEIKQHMFFKEHRFADGTVRRFDSDCDQSDAWDRLFQGKGTETDVEMLKHEYVELTQMKLYGYDYEKAHEIANSKHNWWAMVEKEN